MSASLFENKPQRCPFCHQLWPGKAQVSWKPCICEPAREAAAGGRGMGHACRTVRRCTSYLRASARTGIRYRCQSKRIAANSSTLRSIPPHLTRTNTRHSHDQPRRRKCPVTRPACRQLLLPGGARSKENHRPRATPGGARSKEASGAISECYGQSGSSVARPITSVSGNDVNCSCFRIFTLICCAWSALVRWRPSPWAAVVTDQLVTHHRP